MQVDLPVSVSHPGHAVTERADGGKEEQEDRGGREMRPHVPHLPAEVQASESWRKSKHRAKIGEKNSLLGSILEPVHTHGQTLSKTQTLLMLSLGLLGSFSFPPPQ